MSSSKLKFTCPKCDLEQEFDVFENVNVTLEPAFKKQVLERTLGRFTCKGCRKSLSVRHSILYNDVKEKVIIWLPQGETRKPSIEEGSVVMTMMAKAGYRFRWVTSYNQLVEKIRIFDDRQDDRALELLKMELASVRQSGSSQNFFYDGLVQKAGACRNVRLAEVRKEGPQFHEMPLEKLQRHQAIVSQAGNPQSETAKWLQIDQNYAMETLKNVVR
jgi:hypothetical protein